MNGTCFHFKGKLTNFNIAFMPLVCSVGGMGGLLYFVILRLIILLLKGHLL